MADQDGIGSLTDLADAERKMVRDGAGGYRNDRGAIPPVLSDEASDVTQAEQRRIAGEEVRWEGFTDLQKEIIRNYAEGELRDQITGPDDLSVAGDQILGLLITAAGSNEPVGQLEYLEAAAEEMESVMFQHGQPDSSLIDGLNLAQSVIARHYRDGSCETEAKRWAWPVDGDDALLHAVMADLAYDDIGHSLTRAFTRVQRIVTETRRARDMAKDFEVGAQAEAAPVEAPEEVLQRIGALIRSDASGHRIAAELPNIENALTRGMDAEPEQNEGDLEEGHRFTP